jgi:thiamine-monophosphate kinase
LIRLPLNEKALIRRIRQRAGHKSGLLGIGDDCACIRIPQNHEVLVTTDFSLEDVHFRRDLQPAKSIGHRCLLRGLSDIAAMGGEPRAIFLSLAIPPRTPQRWINEFFNGLLDLAKEFKTLLAGGDTSQSPTGKILADIVVLGSVPKGKELLRSGARPGDRIFVTGSLGGHAATLKVLLQSRKNKIAGCDLEEYFYPEVRLEVGRILREKRLATSMVDISDGLSTDLNHICAESAVGAEIDAEAIPLARIGKFGEEVDIEMALHGGEDYELLFTAPPDAHVPGRISNVPITEIGSIVRGRSISLRFKNKVRNLRPLGWEHFRE